MTSWSKMDDVFFPEESRGSIKDVFGMLDKDVGDTLWQMSQGSRKDFEEQLVVRFEIKDLKEIRVKIFRAALDKVDFCLSQVARARIKNADDMEIDDDMVSKADSLLRVLSPQDMINRRCIKKMVNDVTDLLEFIANEKAEFPTDMIKSAAADVQLSKDLRQAVACVQKIVTSEACSEDLMSPGGISDTENDNEIREENKDDMSNMNIDGNVEDSMQGETYSCEGDSSDGDMIDRNIGQDNSDYDLIRALTGMSGENQLNSEEMANCAGIRTESIQDEICKAVHPLESTEPICPLIIVSETSPKNIIPDDTKGGKDNWGATEGRNLNLTTPLEAQTESNPEQYDSYANSDCASVSSHWLEGQDGNRVTPVRTNENESARTHRVELNSTFSVHVINPVTIVRLPSNDKTTSTADLWEHIKSTWKAGDTRVILDYDNPEQDLSMSGMEGRRPWPKKRDSGRKDDSCRECGKSASESSDWKDRVNRRVSNAENACSEKSRMMRILREEVSAEMREVTRRLDALECPRSSLFSNPQSTAQNTRFADTDLCTEPSAAEPRMRGRPSKRSTARTEHSEEMRRRAASFSGPIRNTSKQGRLKQPVPTVDPPHSNRTAPPKEQRTQAQRSNVREERRNDNPIKDWLSSAKNRSDKQENIVIRPADRPTATRSPSWADECTSDEDELETTGDGGTPTSSLYDVSRDDSQPLEISPEHHSNDDLHEIPPSGQITYSRPATCDAEADRMYALPQPRPAERIGGRNAPETSNTNAGNKNHGPKHRNKGNDANVHNDNTTQNPGVKANMSKNGTKQKTKANPGKKGKSYAKVAGEGDWLKVQSNSGKKRKFEKVSPKVSFPLKGSASTIVRDVYLQGLKVEDGQTPEDVIDSVRSYCVKNGIKPVFISIIPVKYDCTRTGCRLTIIEEDFERVLMETFWPDLITVREWTARPRDGRQNNGNEGRGQFDDDN